LFAAVVVAMGTLLKDLFIGEVGKRLLTSECKDLPESHSKGPDVTLARDVVQYYGFPGHPADRKRRHAIQLVIVATVETVTNAKVGYLDGKLMANEAVPCR